MGLWSASFSFAGANFLTTFLVILNSPVTVYAAYTTGQALLALSAAWSDGGLTNTMRVMAAQQDKQITNLHFYRKIGMKYSWRIVPFAYALILIIIGILLQFSTAFKDVDFYILALFGAIGVIASRTNFNSALIYACGNFKQYNWALVLPALIRLFLIGMAILMQGSLSLNTLALLTLAPAVFGWFLVFYYLKAILKNMPSGSETANEEEINAKIKRFLKPSFYSVVLSSIAYNLTLIGSSLFATSASIAAYGVFQRVNRIVMTFVGTLNEYVSRRLYLMPTSQLRKQQGILYTLSCMAIYSIYSILAIGVYVFSIKFFDHYSLHYPVEFAIFLVANGVGYLHVIFDSILASYGTARHRILGTTLSCTVGMLVVFLLRPDTLFLMVCMEGAIVLPVAAYYAYLFFRRTEKPK